MHLKLLSPSRPLADAEVTSVSVPATLGMMEILPHHAPMVAEIDVGKLSIRRTDGETLHYFVSGGYVDVLSDHVVVLADVVEPAGEIDRTRAENALKRAEERLVNLSQLNIDIARAQYAQKRAKARLNLLGQ